MNTYALLRAGGKPTAEESMKNYDGNICRCTGYRNLVQVESVGKEEANISAAQMKGSPNWLRRHLQECSYRISCNTHYHYPMFVYFWFIHFLKFSQNPKIKKTYTKRLSTTKFYNDIFCVYMHACIYVQQYIIIYTVYSIYSIQYTFVSNVFQI